MNIELLGVSDAVRDFNMSKDPAAIYLDVRTGDVWTHHGVQIPMDGAFCVASRPFGSNKTIDEAELLVACNRNLSVLIPQF